MAEGFVLDRMVTNFFVLNFLGASYPAITSCWTTIWWLPSTWTKWSR